MRKPDPANVLLALVAAGAALALMLGVAPHGDDAPDVTMAPCSAWADTSHPNLPPYTMTDRCVAPNGQIIEAP